MGALGWEKSGTGITACLMVEHSKRKEKSISLSDGGGDPVDRENEYE